MLSKFISPDSIVPNPADPSNFNRYSYVLNIPLVYTDPTGHCGSTDMESLTRSEQARLCSRGRHMSFDLYLELAGGSGDGSTPLGVLASDLKDAVVDAAVATVKATARAAGDGLGIEDVDFHKSPELGLPVLVIESKDSGLDLVNRTMDVVRGPNTPAFVGPGAVLSRDALDPTHLLESKKAPTWRNSIVGRLRTMLLISSS